MKNIKKQKGAFMISIGTITSVITLSWIFWGNISSDRERISSLETASEMTLTGQARIEKTMNDRFNKLESIILNI